METAIPKIDLDRIQLIKPSLHYDINLKAEYKTLEHVLDKAS